MNAPKRSEQDLARLLLQLAQGSRPDYRETLVEVVARTPQRRAWTIPGRWLPMDTSVQRIAPAPAFRVPIALLLVLVLVAAALAALAVASRPSVPTPFGPAANGRILYGSGGDLYLLDPVTMQTQPLVVDPTTQDEGGSWSLDGSRVGFVRVTGEGDSIYVVNADGTGLRSLTAPLSGVSSLAWSPDGTTIAVASETRGFPQVQLVAADGSGIRPIEIGVPAEQPVWRPPDGHQLLVRAQVDGFRELLLVDVATGVSHRLPMAHVDGGASMFDGQRASWSPDGRRLLYEQGQAQTGTRGAQVIRLHLADVTADGTFTSDRRLQLNPKSDYEYAAVWLTTGDRIAFDQQLGCTWQVWIAPDADMTRAVPVAEPFEDCTNEGIDFVLSPDGARVITVRGTAAAADPMWIGGADGQGRLPVLETVTDIPSWQRVTQ